MSNNNLTDALQSLTLGSQDYDAQAAQLETTAARLSAALTELMQDRAIIAGLHNTISSLQPLSSALLRQLTHIERLDDWVLVGGTKANTGQSGSPGTATWVNGTLSSTPAGEYYDAMFYRVLPGVPLLGVYVYRMEFLADPATCQAVEMDGSHYTPLHRVQPAAQVELNTKTVRYYDPQLPDWVDTHIPVPVDDWASVEVIGHTEGTVFVYDGIAINDSYSPLGIRVNTKAKATAVPYIHAGVQADSRSSGAPLTVNFRSISYAWL